MIQIVIVIFYFALIIAIAFYMQRRTKDIKDFMVGSGVMGVGALLPMMFGEYIAGSSTTGGASMGYSIGFAGAWYSLGLAIGAFLCMLGAIKFFRVMGSQGAQTLGHSFEMYFSKRYSMLLTLITVVVYLIYYALQPVAAASIIAPMFGVSYAVARWVISIFFIIMAAAGGIKGLSRMNFVHSIVMYVGFIITAFLAVRFIGGTEQLMMLPSSYFNPFSRGHLTTFSWALGTALSMPAGAMVCNAAISAKSFKTAKTAFFLAGIILIPFGFICSLIGMAAKAGGLVPTVVNSVLYDMASTISPVIGGIASMAVLAAVMSSAPAFLLMFSNTFVGDVYTRRIKPDATSNEQLVVSRISIVVVGIICTYLGGNVSSVLGTLLSAMQIRNIAAVVLFAALLWKRVNEKAGFWSLLIGGIIAAAWFFLGNPYGIEPIIPSCIVGIIVLVAITLITSKGEYEGHKRYIQAKNELFNSEDPQTTQTKDI